MKNSRKRSLVVGSIITLLILSTPYFLYFYQSVPAELESYTTIFGTLNAGHWGKVTHFFYFFFAKFVPLMLLMIWFVTNKHWWVHVIIIPISVYLFQLLAVINDSTKSVDELEFIYTVPITAIIMLILYFLRNKLSVFIQAVDLKKEMDETMGSDF